MRKRNRKTIIVENAIDYDKLAEAIVKAKTNQQERYSPSREWMKYILIPMFWIVAILSGLLAIGIFITFCQNLLVVFESGIWTGVLTILFELLIASFTAGFCIFSFVTAKEMYKENDRAYIASMFSNIVAIVALVVALVALF